MGKESARLMRLQDIIFQYTFIFGVLSLIMYLIIAMYSVVNTDIALDFGEGPIVYESWLLSQGKSFYFPYIHRSDLTLVVPYPPLFQLVSAAIIRLGIPPLSATRSVSLMSTLLLTIVIYRLLRLLGVTKRLSALTAILTLSLPVVFSWSPLARVDMLGILLSVIALYYILSDRLNRAMIFMSLALFTKQSFIALPIIIGIYLLFIKEYRQFVKLGMILALPHLVLSLWVPYYFDNVVLANLYQKLDFDVFFRGMRVLSFYYWGIIVLSFYSYFYLVSIHKSDLKDKYSTIGQYFVLSLVLSVFTYAKPGSSINYFIEPLVLALILVALLLDNFNTNYDVRILLYMFVFGLIVSSIFANSVVSTAYLAKLDTDYTGMYEYIGNFSGPIFFEDPYLAFKTKKGEVFDIFLLTKLNIAGVWNQDKLLRDINNTKFSLIVTMRPLENYPVLSPESRYSPELVNVIQSHYKLDKVFGRYYFYIPINNTNEGEVNESREECS